MLASKTLLQNRYFIVRQIGQGGMGAVYQAIDKRLGSTVALKESFFDDDRLRKAFEREARLLASLRHSALPKVSDHFTEGDGQFLVMEFIPGNDLSKMLKRRDSPFPVEKVLVWGDQLLDALEYLHSQQPPIIHRDIKPQNLKLTDREEIILLDFGLAKNTPQQKSRVTAGGSVIGYTPHYAPLEQIHGSGTDCRSDLYGLAATLYHLLTGVEPVDAMTRAVAALEGRPDPLRLASDLNPDVPPAIAAVLMKAMALNREHRYASAADMRLGLREAGRPYMPGSEGEKTASFKPLQIVAPRPQDRQEPEFAADPYHTLEIAPSPDMPTERPLQVDISDLPTIQTLANEASESATPSAASTSSPPPAPEIISAPVEIDVQLQTPQPDGSVPSQPAIQIEAQMSPIEITEVVETQRPTRPTPALPITKVGGPKKSGLRMPVLALIAVLAAGIIVYLVIQFGAPMMIREGPKEFQAGQFALTKENASLRSGPDANSPQLGYLRENARVKIVERAAGNWYKVQLIDRWDKKTANAEEGYMHSDSLKDRAQ